MHLNHNHSPASKIHGKIFKLCPILKLGRLDINILNLCKNKPKKKSGISPPPSLRTGPHIQICHFFPKHPQKPQTDSFSS